MSVLTVAKFGALLLIMVLGAIRIFSGQARMLAPSLGTGYVFNLGSFFIALYAAFWAYEGWYVCLFIYLCHVCLCLQCCCWQTLSTITTVYVESCFIGKTKRRKMS